MKKLILKEEAFKDFLSFQRSKDPLKDLDEVSEDVRKIISKVRLKGDEALLEYTKKFDKLNLKKIEELLFTKSDMHQAYSQLDKNKKQSLKYLKKRIKKFHESIPLSDWQLKDKIFEKYGQVSRPIKRVGLYAPGGNAIYPSSVLMTSVLAKLAGVKEILLSFPPSRSDLKELMLAAAHIGGVDEVVCLGGAQSIAAMTFGTDTIKKVDKIFGPGNQYVAEAKRQVYGVVGIDGMTGPSEVMIIADESANNEMLALDLIAQAEHGPNSACILVLINSKNNQEFINKLNICFNDLNYDENSNAYLSLKNYGRIVNVKNYDEAKEICNEFNPEHLQIVLKKYENINLKDLYAGAIFLGQNNTAVLGDYCAGPSHVIPTNGATKFSSQLSVQDFFVNSSFTQIEDSRSKDFKKVLNNSKFIAEQEGLLAHAKAVGLRIKKLFN